MNGFILLVTLAMGSSAYGAQQFFVEAKLLVDGKVVATPQIMALEGEEAFMEVGDRNGPEYRLGVVATCAGDEVVKDEINMKLQVHFHDGKNDFDFAPQVLAKSGSEATIRLHGKDNQKVEMRVVATRQ